MSASAALLAKSAFDTKLFASLLTTTTIGHHLVYIDECLSTMDYVPEEGTRHGTVILAECQTAGRGRVAGRSWMSRPLGNLYFTVLLKPKDIMALSRIGIAASIAAVEACRAAGAVRAVAKWPNDIWLPNKKLAGMLIDSRISNTTDIDARLGIGINVNELFEVDSGVAVPPGLASPTSLRAELGHIVSRESLLANFFNRFEPYLDWDTPLLVDRYASYDFLCALDAVVVMPHKAEQPTRLTVKAEGFTPQGYLIVRHSDGSRQELSAEEVSVQPGTL